jgi:hypothetical protein
MDVSEIMAELDVKDQLAALVTAIREQTAKLDDLSDKMSMVEVSMGSMEEVKPALMDLALWKPHMDHAVGALQADLSDLRTHMDHLVGALQPPATAAVPSAAASGDRRVGTRLVACLVTKGIPGQMATASTPPHGVR